MPNPNSTNIVIGNAVIETPTASGIQIGFGTAIIETVSTPRRSPARRAIAAGFNPFWEDSPAQWDTVVLQGVNLPGIATVDGMLGRKLDVLSPPGSDGATIRDKGYEPAKIVITLRLWAREHFDALDQANIAIIARRGRQRIPLQIVHPALNQAGIRQVYLEKVGILKPSAMKGMWEIQYHVLEFTRPTPRPPQFPPSQSVGDRSSFGQSIQQQAAAAQTANDPANGAWTATNQSAVQGTLGHP